MAQMILNLTQHLATPEQVAAGVVDLPERARVKLSNFLTFEEIPDESVMIDRAEWISDLAKHWRPLHIDESETLIVMLGGAPWFMHYLVREFVDFCEDITPVFAFSQRESVDELQPDGSVLKVSKFKHLGFVEMTL